MLWTMIDHYNNAIDNDWSI